MQGGSGEGGAAGSPPVVLDRLTPWISQVVRESGIGSCDNLWWEGEQPSQAGLPPPCPDPRPAHRAPSLEVAVHGLHPPEPVLREEAAHRNFVFLHQVLLLQDLQGWGPHGTVRRALPAQAPCPCRAPAPGSPRARPTWPLARVFLRRTSANWQHDRKGSRQASCGTRAARCSQERVMGSRVSPSWQQRLATGEVYWPTAGPRVSTGHTPAPLGTRSPGGRAEPPAHPPPTQGLALRPQSPQPGPWGAEEPRGRSLPDPGAQAASPAPTTHTSR